MGILFFILLIWWAFGVALIFGQRSVWHRFYTENQYLHHRPQWVVLLTVLAVCIVLFPIPLSAPFEYGFAMFQDWRRKRRLKKTLLKTFKTLQKGKNEELKSEFQKLIDLTKRL